VNLSLPRRDSWAGGIQCHRLELTGWMLALAIPQPLLQKTEASVQTDFGAALVEIDFKVALDFQLSVVKGCIFILVEHVGPPGDSIRLALLYQKRAWANQGDEVAVGELAKPARDPDVFLVN
jgi:hypothetical protein